MTKIILDVIELACLECGESFVPKDANDKICTKCVIKFGKRGEFRNLIQQLNSILKLDHLEASYMRGFSYAEMENFSLTFRKVQKRFNFPIELRDFVNEGAKIEAEEVFKAF